MRKGISLCSQVVLSVWCASCLTTCWCWLASGYVWVMMQDVVWAALHSAREKQREGDEWGGAVKRALEENMW